MPTISCINCGRSFDLSSFTYWNFNGDVKCPNCSSLLTILLEGGELRNISMKSSTQYPTIQAPSQVIDDINEALTCHSVKAYKASVVMCRRALEQVCTNLNAKGNSLSQKIGFLKNTGVISNNEYNMFSEIRFFGNYGAHPSNDLLNGVTYSDSKLVIEITIHLIKHIYEIPEVINRLKSRRDM